eukprot:UN03842
MDAYKAQLKQYQQQQQQSNTTTDTNTTTTDDNNNSNIITSTECDDNINTHSNNIVEAPEQPELCKIRINCVSPGPVLTSVFDKMGFADEQAKQNWIEITGARTVLNRVGNIEEIGATVAFLFSNRCWVYYNDIYLCRWWVDVKKKNLLKKKFIFLFIFILFLFVYYFI